MFFHSWGALGHVVVATALVYIFVVGALRVVGAQALAKMSEYTAARRSGFLAIEQVQAVVHENDGDWSVIPRHQDVTDWPALHGIALPGQATERGATSA